MLRTFRTLFAALLFTPFLSQSNAFSQGITTGSITGTVVDSVGASVVGAQISVLNSATGAKAESLTRATGDFTVQDLPVGSYSVVISDSGFSDLKIENVVVTSGNSNNLGKQALKVGASTQEVTVEGTQPLLETTQSQVSTTFSSEQIQDLPLGNGFDTVALLVPGTVQTHDNNFSNTNGEGFSSNGQRGRSNNFELDGQSNNDNSVAGPQIFFGNQDAIQELQVITNNFSAQYGRNMGSVINYLTKSGTNSFHGTVFEYWNGNTFQSFENSQKNPLLGYCAKGENPDDGCLVPILPKLVENRFGTTLGGPVLRDKLWFFGSGYWDRIRTGGGAATSGTALTPNPTGITLLTSTFPGNPGVVALASNGPFSIKAGNPQAVGATVYQNVTIGGTTVAVPFQAITRSVPSLFNDEEALARGDWQPTTKDHLFIRYFYQNQQNTNASAAPTQVQGSWYNVPDSAQSVGGDWTHTFSTNWLNQVRYSFQETKVLFQSGAQPTCTTNTPGNCTSTIALKGSFSDTSGNTYSNLGFGYADNIPQGRIVKVTQVQDNASWVLGRHSIQFGGEWDYQNSPNPFLPYYNGGFTFGNFNSFLTGSGTESLGNGNFTSKFTESDPALYFQDDWKVMPNLTLNLGLRWEFFSQAVNLLHNETVTREANPATAFWNTELPLSERTFPYTPSNWKNYQPRVGFAFSPTPFNGKLVVRGGFAINFDPAFYNMFTNAATAAPVVNLGTINCDGVVVVCQSGAGALGNQTRAQSLPYIPLGGNPNARNQTQVGSNFHNPYAESYSLGVSYQVGAHWVADVHYVGNHTVGNFQSLNVNPNLLGTALAFPTYLSPSAFCQDPTQIGFGHASCAATNIRSRNNTAFSLYDGLQLKVESQNWHGFSGQLNYTFSKTIDNTSEVFGTFAGGNSEAFAPNPYNVDNAERAISGISVPQVFSASATYQLPIYKQDHSSLKGKLLGGWQINGIYQFDNGQPATLYQLYFNQYTGDTSYCDNGFQAAFSSSVDSCRPILSNAKAPKGTIGFYANAADAVNGGLPGPGWYDYISGNPISGPQAVQYLHNDASDIAAVGINTPFPGVGRSTARATHFSELDTSVFKSTPITERVTFQLQFTAFNILNQQFYGTPDPEIEDPSFQQTYFNTGTSRNLQFGGKIIF